MKSIKSYIALTSVVFALFLVSVLGLYRFYIEHPKEVEIAEQLQLQELNSLSKILRLKKTTLSSVTLDWAHWDDSYQFLTEPTTFDSFVRSNFTPSSFITNKLVGVVYLTNDAQIHYSQGYDFSNETTIDLNQLLNIDWTLITNRFNQVDDEVIHGWLLTRSGPAIYAIANVTDSLSEKDSVGYLIFIQLLSGSEIEFIESITRLKLNFTTPNTKEELALANTIADLAPVTLEEGFQTERYRIIRDDTNTPMVIIHITHTPIHSPNLLEGFPFVFAITGLVALLLMALLERIVHRPMKKHILAIEQMVSEQNLTPLTERFRINEFEKFRSVFNLAVDLVQQQKLALLELSTKDALTAIPNRRAYDTFAPTAWKHAKRHNTTFCFAILDIDYFKQFNDSQGHQAGDVALKQLGALFSQHFCREDDFYARIGGEEFVVILRSSHDDFLPHLEAFRQGFEDLNIPHTSRPDALKVLTISIGAVIVKHPNHLSVESGLAKLYKLADETLYTAKQEGRNQIGVEYINN
ncbi:hypothetical protein DN062_01900 [Nitrincola tibetensis]|uniref:diguanylate cyclase n=1 Tax=Nitrincola tibetensis TaxID=2219697 RepID=A0A364NRY3_9GAMM|nr:diguanylate cyclase [Nitrincola tibetensis]RAU19851.1 hypothetical protein DN062_01900 [Nitrincola tibetensis]